MGSSSQVGARVAYFFIRRRNQVEPKRTFLVDLLSEQQMTVRG